MASISSILVTTKLGKAEPILEKGRKSLGALKKRIHFEGEEGSLHDVAVKSFQLIQTRKAPSLGCFERLRWVLLKVQDQEGNEGWIKVNRNSLAKRFNVSKEDKVHLKGDATQVARNLLQDSDDEGSDSSDIFENEPTSPSSKIDKGNVQKNPHGEEGGVSETSSGEDSSNSGSSNTDLPPAASEQNRYSFSPEPKDVPEYRSENQEKLTDVDHPDKDEDALELALEEQIKYFDNPYADKNKLKQLLESLHPEQQEALFEELFNRKPLPDNLVFFNCIWGVLGMDDAESKNEAFESLVVHLQEKGLLDKYLALSDYEGFPQAEVFDEFTHFYLSFALNQTNVSGYLTPFYSQESVRLWHWVNATPLDSEAKRTLAYWAKKNRAYEIESALQSQQPEVLDEPKETDTEDFKSLRWKSGAREAFARRRDNPDALKELLDLSPWDGSHFTMQTFQGNYRKALKELTVEEIQGLAEIDAFGLEENNKKLSKLDLIFTNLNSDQMLASINAYFLEQDYQKELLQNFIYGIFVHSVLRTKYYETLFTALEDNITPLFNLMRAGPIRQINFNDTAERMSVIGAYRQFLKSYMDFALESFDEGRFDLVASRLWVNEDLFFLAMELRGLSSGEVQGVKTWAQGKGLRAERFNELKPSEGTL